MSDHVPLARSAGRLSAAQENGWVLRYPLWDAYFAVVAVGTGAFIVAAQPQPAPVKAGALAVLVGLAAW